MERNILGEIWEKVRAYRRGAISLDQFETFLDEEDRNMSTLISEIVARQTRDLQRLLDRGYSFR